MFKILKFFIFMGISFIIFSYPISQKPLFNHIYDYSSKYSDNVFESATTHMTNGVSKAYGFVKSVFMSSDPKIGVKEYSDKVHQRLSSQRKKSPPYYKKGPSDNIDNKDRKALKNLLKD